MIPIAAVRKADRAMKVSGSQRHPLLMEVPVAKLRRTQLYVDPAVVQKWRAYYKRRGRLPAIEATQLDDGLFYVLNGNHRALAAEAEGAASIAARVWIEG